MTGDNGVLLVRAVGLALVGELAIMSAEFVLPIHFALPLDLKIRFAFITCINALALNDWARFFSIVSRASFSRIVKSTAS